MKKKKRLESELSEVQAKIKSLEEDIKQVIK